jgi:glycosyltransferase involved in cell wall biosynthesis
MDIFDWEFYIEFNYDILDVFDNSEKSALDHYNQYGLSENRIINQSMLYNIYPLLQFFDYEYYLDANPDLSKINSKFRLIRHYLIQGYKENRKINFLSPIFLCFNFNTKLLNWQPNIQKPLVSIIIPVYNRANIICECIDSLLNQTYTNIEIIIIDDNSTDSTLKQINTYKDSDKIKILSNLKNYGCYTSINFGLSIASGEYITVHGSDDVSFPNRIEELIYMMMTNNLLMCGNYILRSHFKTFKNINLSNTNDIFNSILHFKMDNTTHNKECCNPLVSLGTLIYHKSVFNTIGEYKNIRKGADMIFFEEFLYHYEKIKFYNNDCSHRYLTKILSGNHYKIIDDILYISSEIDHNNLTSQELNFNINSYRNNIYLDNNIN